MARFAILGIGLLALVVRFVYDRLSTLGLFRGDLAPVLLRARSASPALKFIDNTINAEDLHFDPESGLIYAAVQDADGSRSRWFPALGHFEDPAFLDKANGGLAVIDPVTFTASRLKLDRFTGRFATHGIDIVRDPEDPKSLYIHAVNHAANPEYAATLNKSIPDKAHSRIELFHHVIGSDTATWLRSVAHPYIQTPNDIYSYAPFGFYVTNDHHYREGHLRVLEDLGNKVTAGWTNIIQVDVDPNKGTGKDNLWAGVSARVAHHGLHNNNGLGHGPDDTILINDAAGGVTYIARRQEDATLKVFEEVKAESTLDNPSWFQDPYPEVDHDASGIVNAGLAQAHKLAHEIVAGGPIPPVVWLHKGTPGNKEQGWNTTLLYADDSSNLRSASAAILIAIDPKKNDGKKQAWLYASGFAAKGAIALKVDL